MTSLLFLETIVSLGVQVTLLTALVAWVTRKRLIAAEGDTCWTSLHATVLLLTAIAFFVPHFRFFTWADLEPSASHPVAETLCTIVGRFCAWTWISGIVGIVALNVGGMIRATALVRRAQTDEELRGVLQRSESGLATSLQGIEIRVLPDNISPFCWQIHHPIIVLPAVVQHFPIGEQAAIVRHELAHLRLQHPLHLFLQRLVEALFWFHPLVWWASREAAAERELRCDRDAVRSKVEVADYLRSLLRLIEYKTAPPERLPAGMGFMGDATLLSKRAGALAERLTFSPRARSVSAPRRWC